MKKNFHVFFRTSNLFVRSSLALCVSLFATSVAFGATHDLSKLTTNLTAEDGDVLTGSLGDKYKISIADGASVTLNGVDINGAGSWTDGGFAGVSCEGDCSIFLEGTNIVKGFGPDYPGIYVPVEKTLTIDGMGQLTAFGGESEVAYYISENAQRKVGFAAGIGGGHNLSCGNIIINGGTVTATGGYGDFSADPIGGGAGIGTGRTDVDFTVTCGNIVINSGTVAATGGSGAAGIGTGFIYGGTVSCGNISINGGMVTATSSAGAGIGTGYIGCYLADGSGVCKMGTAVCGVISISGGTVTVSSDGGAAGIGTGYVDVGLATCEGISISGGKVFAMSTGGGAGIGIGAIWGGTSAVGHYEGEKLVKGSISISGGEVEAIGGGSAAGIGAGAIKYGMVAYDDIALSGGRVTAMGGEYGAAIGLGYNEYGSVDCDKIEITGTSKLWAVKGKNALHSIGKGYEEAPIDHPTAIGTITIGGKVTGYIEESPYIFPNSYTIVFDKNGGEGVMDNQVLSYGNKLNFNVYTRDGFAFAGWNTAKDGTGMAYTERAPLQWRQWLDLVGADGTLTLYAQWVEVNFSNVVDLSKLTSNYVAQNGDVLTGILNGMWIGASNDYKISIADNATVKLKNADINRYSVSGGDWAGITCEGNCNIVLEGDNFVKTISHQPGIFVPENYTLRISGDGTLEVYGGRNVGAGIGGGDNSCGNIVINGGTITAVGSGDGAGIGSGGLGSCGDIAISGGKVSTISTGSGAGIGGGGRGDCGDIIISGGKVSASGGGKAAGIGCGWWGDCGDITISGGIVFATGGENAAGIGLGRNDSKTVTCGNIAISGGVVSAMGGVKAAGIGTGYNTGALNSSANAICGNITIAEGVSNVTAEKGKDALHSIGIGFNDGSYASSTVGTITVGKKTGFVEKSPFVYPSISELKDNHIAQDGETLSGTLEGDYKISIAPNATVYLKDAVIKGTNSEDYNWAGLTCLGNCNIILVGKNYVKGFYENNPGIHIPEKYKLTISGDGSLEAYSGGAGAGIGGGKNISCGDIEISGGTVYAEGDGGAAGIGTGRNGNDEENYANEEIACGNVTISGGTVNARGKTNGVGIGLGYNRGFAKFGNISISGGTVEASGSTYYAAGIGTSPNYGTVEFGKVTISGGKVTAVGGYLGAGIGLGPNGGKVKSFGDIEISGDSIFVTGGYSAAGIGSGQNGDPGIPEVPESVHQGDITFGKITIKETVSRVIATKGEHALHSIGTGIDTVGSTSSFGTITVGDKVGVIEQSPFIYPSTYGVVFDGNSDYCGSASTQAEGSMDAQLIYRGEKKALSPNAFTCNGRIFIGWDTKANGSGVRYLDGSVVQDLAEIGDAVTLYAQWWNGDLSKLTIAGNYVIPHGFTLSNTLASNSKISIAAGAKVTLNNVTITGVDDEAYKWAGITCEGNCIITVRGKNKVTGFYRDYPGIYVPENYRLTIFDYDYSASLEVEGGSFGAGIGGGKFLSCGDISIQDRGSIIAKGGLGAAGIGSGENASCGNISIYDGTVEATGGKFAPGIGLGASNSDNPITGGNISISELVTKVTAVKGIESPYSVGWGKHDGDNVSLGTITVGDDVLGPIEESPFVYDGHYGIVFYPNGGSGKTEYQYIRKDVEQALNKCTFTREGYIFVGWNTKSDGSGDSYADEATVLNLTELGSYFKLYAQWVQRPSVDLAALTGDYTAKTGYVLTGTLDGSTQPYKISIADGASVVLKDATIKGVKSEDAKWAGITCLGDCKIVLEGTNSVKGFFDEFPGIYVPVGKTLTIDGTGSLDASSNGWAAGIGGGYIEQGFEDDDRSCGNIVIAGGYVKAMGGKDAAGIGGAFRSSCGNITISGGEVDAQGGMNAAGIGLGENACNSYDGCEEHKTSCGDITITDGVTKVTATKGYGNAPFSIGIGYVADSRSASTVGTITIGGVETGYIETSPFTYPSLFLVSVDADGKKKAVFDGAYAGTDALAIDKDIQVDNVVLNRSFSTVGFSTITLPFDIKGSKVTGAKQFLKFNEVAPNAQGVREVHLKRAWCDYEVVSKEIDAMNISDEDKDKAKKSCLEVSGADVAISAYTPYVVQMNDNSLTFDVSAEESVTLKKTPAAVDTVVGNWVFRGTLAPKTWNAGDPEIGNAYGYVAGTGEFQKVGDASSIGALRSYLIYEKQQTANFPGMSNIRANFSTETLPANMDVVIVDDDENGKEHRTVIGKFNTHTGEFTPVQPQNRMFDVKGRRVNETRSVGKGRKAKGVYYGKRGGRD